MTAVVFGADGIMSEFAEPIGDQRSMTHHSRDHVLQRADDDGNLSEQARRVVLAAWKDLPASAPLTAAMSRLGEAELLAHEEAAALAAPDVDEIERACAALRLAAVAQADAERTADALSADRIQFLETGLEFHDRHGAQPCPVCAKGTLDDGWVVQARAALAAELDAASALRVARSAAHRARQALTALVREVHPSVALQAFSVLPVDDDRVLAEHVQLAIPGLRKTYEALQEEAAARSAAIREAQEWLRALSAES